MPQLHQKIACQLTPTVLILSLLLAPLPLHAAEDLKYRVQYKGVLSGFSWIEVSRASIRTSSLKDCSGRGACKVSTGTLSSKGYPMLEAIFKVRYHTSSYYQVKQKRTLAFEMRERKYGDKYLPYGYKHYLTVFASSGAGVDYYRLGSKGEPLPAEAKGFIATDHQPAAKIRVEKVKRKSVSSNSIDRMTLLQLVRSTPLKKGYKATYAGTNGKDQLEFRVTVLGEEQLDTAGKRWSAWKIKVDELEKGDKPVTLYAWLSNDGDHIPLKFELTTTFGSARFLLTSS